MRKYTWKPDNLDHRDLKYTSSNIVIPSKVDLSPTYSLVFDQGQLGSCTGNGISMHLDFTRIKENKSPLIASRLFIYYGERVIENTVNQDAGAQIRDGIKVVANIGACTEKSWPYNVARFKRKPSLKCFNEAKNNVIKQYLRLDSSKVQDLKSCLSEGYSFVFGFSVFQSFESQEVAQTGMVPMPVRTDKPIGGHAVICIGYDDKTQTFKCRNSWGNDWGDKGHFYLPYNYMTNTNLADDFWTIRVI